MPHGGVCIKRAAVNIPVWQKKKRERKNIKPAEAVKLEMGRRYCYRYCFRGWERERVRPKAREKDEDEGAMNGRWVGSPRETTRGERRKEWWRRGAKWKLRGSRGHASGDTSVKRNPTDYEGIGFLGINLGARVPPTRTHTRLLRMSYFFFERRIQDVLRERTSWHV